MPKTSLFVACLIAWFATSAQQYPFVLYTPKDGLVNSRVRKAYQDSKGRMYFITFGGLSVYDGARFKNYTTQNGLLSDLVNDVLEIGDDSLLVAVNTSGLNLLVRGEMRTVINDVDRCPVINQFLKGEDGKIYTSTDGGLYRFETNHFEKLSTYFNDENRSIDFLGAIAGYKDFIVLNTNDLRNYRGLFLYNKKTNKIIDALKDLPVGGLTSDDADIIWVSTTQGLFNLDTIELKAGKLKLINPYNFIKTDEFASGNIQFNSNNEVFVASGRKGIIRYGRDGSVLHVSSSELFNTLVENIFVDREDVLWICHDGNGVYKLANTKLSSTDQFSTSNKTGVLFAVPIATDSLWMVMNDRHWVLHTSGKATQFSISPKSAFPLRSNKTHIYGIDLSNLYRAPLPLSGNSIKFEKLFTLPDSAKFGGKAIVDPFESIILFENRNICVVNDGKLIFTYPFPLFDLIEGMHIDKHQKLCLITRAGMMVFSLHPGDPQHYLQKEFQSKKEFGAASPRCLVVDKNGTLWIGTRYDGLLAYTYSNRKLTKLHHYQTQNGLTDNFVTSLACDKNDNIIVGTQTGLDRLVKTSTGDYRLENITKSNNIFSFINAVWTNSDDHAFALSNAGNIFHIEPVKNIPAVAEPQLLLEEMKVNGVPMQFGNTTLALKYYQRNISFSLAAPTFIDERQVKYSYMLSGAGDTRWSDTTGLADISFLNLSPGDYSLSVKAFFTSTSYATKQMTFSFSILPPWWQTWWFRIAIALIGISFFVFAVRNYYRRKLRTQRTTLEKQKAVEKERTRIATDMHDDLGAGLSRIKFLSETIGLKKQQQQPIEEDITKIRQYAHEMIEKMGEIVWALNEKNDSLSDLLSYTRSYAVEYLSINGIHCAVALAEIPSSFVSGEYRRNIFLAIKEILHNVVKHSEAAHVNIIIESGQQLSIIIRDDGKGFDPLRIRPFSNGLANIRKRMSDIGGSIHIASTKGTAIYLTAPLP